MLKAALSLHPDMTTFLEHRHFWIDKFACNEFRIAVVVNNEADLDWLKSHYWMLGELFDWVTIYLGKIQHFQFPAQSAWELKMNVALNVLKKQW